MTVPEVPADPATTLVLRNSMLPPVPLDSAVDLLAEERECASMIKWWSDRQAKVKERIAVLLGDSTSGTVNGDEVVTYEWQDRYNTTAFTKKYPNLARVYTRPVTKEQLDFDLIKSARPDLAEEFQVRAMRVKYEPPGGR